MNIGFYECAEPLGRGLGDVTHPVRVGSSTRMSRISTNDLTTRRAGAGENAEAGWRGVKLPKDANTQGPREKAEGPGECKVKSAECNTLLAVFVDAAWLARSVFRADFASVFTRFPI